MWTDHPKAGLIVLYNVMYLIMYMVCHLRSNDLSARATLKNSLGEGGLHRIHWSTRQVAVYVTLCVCGAIPFSFGNAWSQLHPGGGVSQPAARLRRDIPVRSRLGSSAARNACAARTLGTEVVAPGHRPV